MISWKFVYESFEVMDKTKRKSSKTKDQSQMLITQESRNERRKQTV